MQAVLLFLTVLISFPALAEKVKEDPRSAKNDISACVSTAKQFLRDSEYDEESEEQDVIGACRDVDLDCLKSAASNLYAIEKSQKATLLPVVRACRGIGMGSCYKKATENLITQQYAESAQVTAILKKCE